VSVARASSKDSRKHARVVHGTAPPDGIVRKSALVRLELEPSDRPA
jgi:hypothetical protein